MMMMSQTLTNSIHFEHWTPNHVADWLTGLDDSVLPYGQVFLDNNIDGKRLLMLSPYDLEKIGISKIGHQELMMEAVDLLRSLRYGYDTENLQHLALQLGCKARSLHNEIQAKTAENDKNRANISPGPHPHRLSVNILSALADMIMSVKNIVSWLDRAPFESIYGLCLLRNSIVKLGIDLVSASQKDNKQNGVEESIMKSCNILVEVCDELVINNKESLVVQPASLEQATIRKKPGEELGMHIQSSYYGIHVIGGVKDRSPAAVCGKIEKGDEVIQVNHRTVVGWQLTKLVNSLKEKPKEVTLLLKKRPHHISPYGHVPNKKKQMNKNAVTVSTLPKVLKKRRSRDGDPAKQPRPSLQELVSNTQVDDIDSPREERTSDEKDDGNDTDNDVFRSGSESPQYVKPSAVDPKQRRATVSGGSPTLSRPLLVIEDIDTPTRPKSFTVAATDSPQIEFKDVGIPGQSESRTPTPGEESNLLRLGDASKKRQEFRSAKSTPPSLEFTVKKPTPIVQEPPPQLKLTKPEQDYKDDGSESPDKTREYEIKPSLELLEVPGRFKNFIDYSGTEEDPDSSETGKEGISNASSTDTLKEEEKSSEFSEDRTTSEQQDITSPPPDQSEDKEVDKIEEPSSQVDTKPKNRNMAGSTTDDPNTQGSQNDQGLDSNGNNPNDNTQNVSNNDVIESNSTSAIDNVNSNSNEQPASNTENNANNNSIQSPETKKKPIPAERHSQLKQTKSNTSQKDLFASSVDFEKPRMVAAAGDVALPPKEKNQPTLMKIRKLESVTQADVDRKNTAEKGAGHAPVKKVEFATTEPEKNEEETGYKIVIVSGLPQKIPIDKQSSIESPVQMRQNRRKTKKVNRRVSCKDLGEGDCQGWLYKEKSRGEGPLSKHWLKRWCVLKRQSLFCFRDNEDIKAESVIHLPAFKVSPAPEIKTRKFAFKIHNTGTMFVFASERQDDMSKWMNKLGLAAIDFSPSGSKLSTGNENFSESESEDEGNTGKGSDGSSSIPNSPSVKREATETDEDITILMRSIQNQNLTIDGKNKNEGRRRTLSKMEVEDMPSAEQIDKLKRMHSLQRTLKAKEEELAHIEMILSKRADKNSLKTFEEKYFETSASASPQQQPNSDSDSSLDSPTQ